MQVGDVSCVRTFANLAFWATNDQSRTFFSHLIPAPLLGHVYISQMPSCSVLEIWDSHNGREIFKADFGGRGVVQGLVQV